jgi:restriction endonuclease Mrr
MNTSPSEAPVEPQQETAFEELKEGVEERLLPLCREWSTGEFDALVLDVAMKTWQYEQRKRDTDQVTG